MKIKEQPYRTLEGAQRGPLTFAEKARSALRGLLRLDPLLEINRSGMDPSLPREERFRYAHKLGNTASCLQVFDYLSDEKDPMVKEALAKSFLEAFTQTMKWYENSLCSIYTGVGSDMMRQERDEFAREARNMATSLLRGVGGISEDGRAALRSVIDHRPD